MLHFRTVGEGRPLVIVHGLFGSGDNWATLAGKFPGYQVFLPDLPNHGASPWTPQFSLPFLADALADFHHNLALPPCPWIGHSLGGKAAMELALSHPQAITALAVLDMAPRASPPRYPGFVAALRALELSGLASRSEAQARLASAIPDTATLQFLLKSLVPGPVPGTWRWKLNLEALEAEYAQIWKAVAPGRRWDGPTFFLSGGASDYVQPGDEEEVLTLFPRARFEAIDGAGHWLHAEKPIEVLAALNRWLEEQR